MAIQDLIAPDQPPDVQEIAFQFVCALIEGQYADLGLMRVGECALGCGRGGASFGPDAACDGAGFFHVVKSAAVPVDWRLEVLKQLTKDGRDLAPFEVYT